MPHTRPGQEADALAGVGAVVPFGWHATPDWREGPAGHDAEEPETRPARSDVPAARVQSEPNPESAHAPNRPPAAAVPHPADSEPLAAGVPHPAHPEPPAAGIPRLADPDTPTAGVPRPADSDVPAEGIPRSVDPEPLAAAVPHPALPEPPAAGVPHPAHPDVPAAGFPRPADSDVPAAGVPHPAHPEPPAAGVPRPAGSEPPAAGVPHPAHPDAPAAGVPRPADSEPPAAGVPRPADSEPPAAGVRRRVVDLVAQAVVRGIREREEDDAQDVPRPGPGRGAAVTEVPVHLPFRRAAHPPEPPAGARATPPRPPAAATATPRTPAGRRVPRGDDRLREHRGPVLPGWAAVLVGALALTGCAAVLWRAGAVPAVIMAAFGATPRAYHGLRATHWPPLAFLGIVALVALGGLGRAKAGHAWVLTLFGRYRGTVRRTGLTWVSPLLLRRRVDVRLRHWRSEPMPAVDSGGLALQVVVQVVWQVKDTARATLAVADHTEYLAEQVESAMARVLSQLPADAFHEDAPTLRDAEAVGDALTRMLAAETEAVGVEVFSAQPTRIEYAPEVAQAMRRRRVAAIDAKHRDAVLTSVVDAVDDTVHRLTSRGLVELDDYERKALVKDLTVAFYTGRAE
ncbi:SPFH domain-containing protein [Streptomyces sp. APSN-46.1]|uniref:SPFH domain-containing protein n=1 Tax=Streptomyces sp. APSN-46.1 TaxID=2929049 RepID=UPI001FB40410|nr:SPFH domain-containing protein [Streptomyces sp. APSN-46.1]MCJ1677158.1 SPFH domain-containing protein [Streptomyces sp. APSN-46.1]